MTSDPRLLSDDQVRLIEEGEAEYYGLLDDREARKEQVRTLREALTEAAEELEAATRYLGVSYGDDTSKGARKAAHNARAALESTKDEP